MQSADAKTASEDSLVHCGARNHLQANRSLGFCFEIPIQIRVSVPDRVFTECRSTCALAAPSTIHGHMAR
jgi:hypothetical protein